VASLFPDARPEVTGSRAWVLPVIGPKPPPQRLTLTFRVLAAAHDVWVLASGAGKERALADSLSPGMLTPLGRLLELRVQTRIFTDIPVLA
jgi:6-phosphogluconolactonase